MLLPPFAACLTWCCVWSVRACPVGRLYNSATAFCKVTSRAAIKKPRDMLRLVDSIDASSTPTLTTLLRRWFISEVAAPVKQADTLFVRDWYHARAAAAGLVVMTEPGAAEMTRERKRAKHADGSLTA